MHACVYVAADKMHAVSVLASYPVSIFWRGNARGTKKRVARLPVCEKREPGNEAMSVLATDMIIL